MMSKDLKIKIAKNLNTTVINSNFLKYAGIMPTDW